MHIYFSEDLRDKTFMLLYHPLSANVYLFISKFLIMHVYYQYLQKKKTLPEVF